MPVVSHPPSISCCAGPSSTPLMTSCRHLEWLFSPSEAISAPGQSSPAPSASPHRASAPVPHHCGAPRLNSVVVITLCLGLGTKNLFLSFLQHFHQLMQILKKQKTALQCLLPFVESASKPLLYAP